MVNHLQHVPEWVHAVVLPLNRWLHIIAMAALVGGTLFYEFVIPKAIEDLKPESRLAVIGRTRWAFRRLVTLSVVTLLVTGAISTWRLWPLYHGRYATAYPWVAMHIGLGVLGALVALGLTFGLSVPPRPFLWLRVNFVILLVVAYTAAVSRHIRLSISDTWERYYFPPPGSFPVNEQPPTGGETLLDGGQAARLAMLSPPWSPHPAGSSSVSTPTARASCPSHKLQSPPSSDGTTRGPLAATSNTATSDAALPDSATSIDR